MMTLLSCEKVVTNFMLQDIALFLMHMPWLGYRFGIGTAERSESLPVVFDIGTFDQGRRHFISLKKFFLLLKKVGRGN